MANQDMFKMDALFDFYDSPMEGGVENPFDFKKTGCHGSLLNLAAGTEDSKLGLADLDPSVELSFDLQALIEKAAHQQEEEVPQQLFPEVAIHNPTHVELATSSDLSYEADLLGYSQTYPDLIEIDDQMPQADQIEEKQTPVLTIKQEDLANFTASLPDGYSIIGLGELEDNINSSPRSPTSSVYSEAESTTSSSVYVKSGACTHSLTTQRGSYKAKAPSKGATRRRALDPNTQEYKARRDRNNVAVRKSRAKAKERQTETESRVKILSAQNDKLQKKCDLLTKELTVLKGLFSNVGAHLPADLHNLLK